MSNKDALQKLQEGITETSKQIQEGVTETSRQVWYAGLGVLSTVEEEGTKLFNRFVEMGKDLVEKGKEFEQKDKVSGVTAKFGEAAKFVEEKLQAASDKVGFSGSSDIKALNEKVDKLAESVAALVKKSEKKDNASKG